MGLKRKFSIGCGLSALLGVGFVLGFLLCLIMVANFARKAENWHTEASQRFITNHLSGFLDLSEEQREQLQPIVAEGLEKRWRMRQEYRERTDRLFVEEYIPRINQFLDEAQRERLQERLQQWRKQSGLNLETGESNVPGKPANILDSEPSS